MIAILVFSQYVEEVFASELLATERTQGLGYLLKDRVAEVTEFVEAVRRVGAGGTALDPEVVSNWWLGVAGRIRWVGSPTERAAGAGLDGGR